ncbi:MAG TPA: carboxylating nicotinate-nucleotide diphosphorylase [Phycisphaerales bacterium]|nr:carboxylating nicotinate-nucleotide diphosphorylase [Phycisphaerales bacterium]
MLDLNDLSLEDLFAHFRDTPRGNGIVRRLIELAREEDLGEDWPHADVTTQAFIKPWAKGAGRISARRPCVVSGLALIDDVLTAYRADVDVELHAADGDSVAAGAAVATLKGNLSSMVTLERVLLNFIMRLSGVATRTAAYVAAAKAAGGRARVYDTRKTTPGLRLMEKYAVRCGGGHCHRLGLHDAVLIKDNHLAALREDHEGMPLAEQVREAVRRARLEAPKEGLRFVMLEVDSLEQFRQVVDGGACGPGDDRVNIVLLDNMTVEQLREAVALRDAAQARVELEASGGVTLETIGAVAATGVERISTGGLTHGATWVDFGMDL